MLPGLGLVFDALGHFWCSRLEPISGASLAEICGNRVW